MTRLFLILLMLAALLAGPARSDALRPGYLEIRQTTPDTYNLLFKIPALGEDLRLGIYLALPEGAYDAVFRARRLTTARIPNAALFAGMEGWQDIQSLL